MDSKSMSFEEVNQHIEAVDLKKFEGAKPQSLGGSEVCEIYQVIRPILAILKGLPLIPAKWRKAVELFMTAMDAACNIS